MDVFLAIVAIIIGVIILNRYSTKSLFNRREKFLKKLNDNIKNGIPNTVEMVHDLRKNDLLLYGGCRQGYDCLSCDNCTATGCPYHSSHDKYYNSKLNIINQL